VTSSRLAVLVDPGIPKALSELLQDSSIPLLPMGTRPMLAHWLDRLLAADIRDVLLLLEHMPEKTREWLEAFTPEGMTISCASIRKGQPFKTQHAHLSGMTYDSLVVIDLSAFPMLDMVDALKVSLAQGAVTAVEGLSHWAQKLVKQTDDQLHLIPASSVVLVTLPADIWRINLDLLAGKLTDPNPFGFEPEPHCYVGSNCKIAGDVRYHSPLAIGESCIFSSRVNIGPNVVAGDKCVFDDGCFIQDCVVFGRTFVGANTVLRNAVVTGSTVYLVDEDRIIHINDAELLAKKGAVRIRVGLVERLLALISLLLLALPMAGFALYKTLVKQQAWVEEDIFLESGRDLNGFREFRALRVTSLAVTHAGWKKVPWLWQVLRNQMSLVGTSPRSSREFDYPIWVTDAEDFHPGVITLADLTVDAPSSSEEYVIADAYQLARGEVGGHIGMWWRWLLSLCTKKS
jgi:hypothetical protein